MAQWTWLRAPALLAPLLAIGCASRLPPQAPSRSADLDAWVDAVEDHGPARSTTLPRASIAEVSSRSPMDRWGTRTIASQPVEPARPRRHAPVDVSFQKSDMASAFQLLADAGRFNLVMGEGIGGQVSATLRGIDPYDALKAMAEANGVEVRYEGQVVLVKKR